MESSREELINLLLEHAVLRGDFTLTSGRKSDILVDVKRTALHPVGSKLIGEVMLEAVRAKWPDAVAIGGRTLGADPLAVAIARASLDDGGEPLHAFVVRKEPKKHGASQLIEKSGGMADGARVVVLEDTSTTGGSALKAVEAARAEGYDVAGVLTLVNREEGADDAFSAAAVEFAAVIRLDELRL